MESYKRIIEEEIKDVLAQETANEKYAKELQRIFKNDIKQIKKKIYKAVLKQTKNKLIEEKKN